MQMEELAEETTFTGILLSESASFTKGSLPGSLVPSWHQSRHLSNMQFPICARAETCRAGTPFPKPSDIVNLIPKHTEK